MNHTSPPKLISNAVHSNPAVHASLYAGYTASGAWQNQTLAHHAERCAAAHPDRPVVTDDTGSLSFADALAQAHQLAAALTMHGLRQGEVLSMLLPNWREAVVINLACALAGFVCNPIVPIYRDAELRFILQRARSRMVFLAENFRGLNHLDVIRRLRTDLPDLLQVISVRSRASDCLHYGDLFNLPANVSSTTSQIAVGTIDANAIKLLLYTSGTTGEPKGVLHSHNTLSAELAAVRGFWGLGAGDVFLMPSPVTHISGYLYALELPFYSGMHSVLMERWDADAAIDLIERHRISATVGATPFLTELLNAAERRAVSLPSLRLFACGGASVPPELVLRALVLLPGCQTCRIYGSSEAPTITLGVARGDPPERVALTDGVIVNHEVWVVDPDTGASLGLGQEGEILTRGPELMLGYTESTFNQEAFDAQGFFRTGDLGTLDARGYITITGRKKDLIIRGGENISPREIEELLLRHPAIADVAVVAMPHPRMAETPCAFVVPRPGHTITLDDVGAFLEAQRLARQKFPEALWLVDELPRTPSGKVQKNVLRERLKA